MSREEQFLSQLDLIERVISWVCSRRGLRGADSEDFASTVKTRIIENDYEVLAKFEGRSSLKTYLAAVVNRMYLDFQVQRFGKWRASAAARRLGPIALRLERLLFRDGLTFDEACGVLGNDPGVVETPEALDLLRRQLPARTAWRAGAGDEPGAREAPDDAAGHEERQALAERTFAAIGRSLARMAAQDRIFLRLHLESGFTVADAARSLGLDQKALYRRKEDLLKAIRHDLAAEGLGAEDAHELLATLDWDAHLATDAKHISTPKNPPARPSQGRGSSTPLESES